MRLTEKQRYELNSALDKVTRTLEDQLSRAVEGDIVTTEVTIKMRIGNAGVVNEEEELREMVRYTEREVGNGI